MKVFAAAAILIALYLLYKIAMQTENKTENKNASRNIPEKEPEPASNVVGRSRYVSPNQRQSAPDATPESKTDETTKSAGTFEPDKDSEEDFSMPLDEEENGDEADLEDEELEGVFEYERASAGGLTYEEMSEALRLENNPAVLRRMEGTDMFEQLIAQDKGRKERIRAILDRHEQLTIDN